MSFASCKTKNRGKVSSGKNQLMDYLGLKYDKIFQCK